MRADERTQPFDYRVVVARGGAHEALQGVDAALPHVDRVRAQLVHGAAEPLGDLPMLVEAQLITSRAEGTGGVCH